MSEREEAGLKDWRAEVAPTDDEKRRAKAAVVAFKQEFPLGGVTVLRLGGTSRLWSIGGWMLWH